MKSYRVPLSVRPEMRKEYLKNISLLTNNTGRLLLIAGDQKMEHANDDFFGKGIAPEDNNPEHLFRIASESKGGALATHLGLISQYGEDYKDIPYIVKINGRTNLGKDEQDSSKPLWKIDDILNFKKQSGLKIAGIGYTLYLGGTYEAKMLASAAKLINKAHQAGLVAILWIYPRGKNIKEEDVHTIAGAAGVGACLDADFIKLKYPYAIKDRNSAAKKYQEVTTAAGRSRVICVGGSKQPAKEILNFLNLQINTGNSYGLAIGRNLHQRPLDEAVRLARAIGAMLHNGATLKEAEKIYLNKESKKIVVKNSKFLGLF